MTPQDLREDVLELKAQQTGLAATCTGMNLRLSKIEKCLLGNGEPTSGLVVQMAKMQQSVSLLLKVAGVIGGAVAVSLIGIFFKLATS